MGIKQDWSEPVKKATAFWGLGFPLVTVIAGSAIAWANMTNAQAALQDAVKLQKTTVENQAAEIAELKAGLQRIDRNMIRIGSKVGAVGLENPR